MKKIYSLCIVNFLAGFLLFQIELIISKILLPKFGGTYLVWSACIAFFQFAMLAGYYYSYLVIKKFGIYRYRLFHLILIVAPLLTFAVLPFQNIAADARIPMVIDIFFKLSSTIGLVFFVLSTVSIISQSWLAASRLPEHPNPYVLYAVSNCGSFVALLTYPFLFEVFFGLKAQLLMWMGAYFIFVVFYLVAYRSITCVKTITVEAGEGAESRVHPGKALYWFLLSAASSIVFLSVTNIITYEVAPCPLLWIMPLCIYLISFTLSFREKPWCPSWIRNGIYAALGLSAGLFFLTEARLFPFLIYVAAYLILLFAVCVFCQHEIYMARPGRKQALAGFYVIIATGGVVGSILAAWISPLLFRRAPLEYLLGLSIVPLALAIKEKKYTFRPGEARWIIYIALLFLSWPVIFKGYNFFGLALFLFILIAVFRRLQGRSLVVFVTLVCLMVVSIFNLNSWSNRGRYVYGLRNYYGIYDVVVKDGLVLFLNGPICHGAQFISKNIAGEPLAYYHRNTPVGQVLESKLFNFKRIGVIGLGAGTLAAYGKPGQEIDFYELDTDVYRIAKLCFDYLDNSAAKIRYVFGDARVMMKKIPDSRYDVMVIDAFTGNSIPVHLLTVDAIEEYRKHLKDDGIILFHVSNVYLELVPILFGNAKILNAHVSLNSNPYMSQAYLPSNWVAMTWDKGKDDILSSDLGWIREGGRFRVNKVRCWTDDRSSITSAFNIKAALDELKNFKIFY